MEWKQVKYSHKDIPNGIKFSFPFCTCGRVMRQVGWAGCPHEDQGSYFFQCDDCKRIDMDDNPIRNTHEELIRAGYESA